MRASETRLQHKTTPSVVCTFTEFRSNSCHPRLPTVKTGYGPRQLRSTVGPRTRPLALAALLKKTLDNLCLEYYRCLISQAPLVPVLSDPVKLRVE